MSESNPDQQVADIGGSYRSGRDLHAVIDEHDRFTATLRGSLASGCGQPEDISGPYNRLLAHLYDRHQKAGESLRMLSNGLLAKSYRDADVEQLNTHNSDDLKNLM